MDVSDMTDDNLCDSFGKLNVQEQERIRRSQDDQVVAVFYNGIADMDCSLMLQFPYNSGLNTRFTYQSSKIMHVGYLEFPVKYDFNQTVAELKDAIHIPLYLKLDYWISKTTGKYIVFWFNIGRYSDHYVATKWLQENYKNATINSTYASYINAAKQMI